MPRDKPCPHYPDCVGCALIGQPYGAQLARKREAVGAALARYPRLASIDVPEVIGSPKAFGYRNQAKLVARRAGRGVLLGIYRPGSHQVVDIRHCPVHHPLIESVLDRVAAVIEQQAVPIYDERTHSGLLRYVVVRVSTWTKRAQLILVTRERALPAAPQLVRALRPVRGLAGVVQNVNPEPGNVIFGSEFVSLDGDLDLVERVGFLKLKSRAGTFLQANIPIARKIYERVLEWAAPTANDTVVDLYCGVGALSFYLATVARHVVGIEASPLAVLDAKANIRMNGFHNVRFHAGETSELLPSVAEQLDRVELITLNPPRKGADEATRRAIVTCAPRRIVYVSCDAATLARDLDWFAAHGYATRALQPYDMLPQTEHVECVVRLERV
ncbi:MAG TPA: 23S rRNA (uracil(1939)-C(5))-methyltransferase RlmD [Candidatus Kryptonia bacterium]|nr:23S rRNA (uracil(1939)-C(5))-methyltransferase RlmD [Candidatus Kryptonia bacterium]